MANHSKDQGLSLLQRNPSRELLLEKMRSKLATTPAPVVEKESRSREVRTKRALSWTLYGSILLVIAGANYLFVGHKDIIVAKLGLESVPSLPAPIESLSADEQALYWTYAMFDIGKFRKQFGVQGYFAINQTNARKSLEALLPEVSPDVLGEISAYTSVAFKSVKGGYRE